MGTRIMSYTVEGVRADLFVSDCANCGVIFGIPTTLEARRREDHGAFYCPNGHSLAFGAETPAERQAREATAESKRLQTRLLAEMDQKRAAEEEAAEAKAREIRLRWRVGNGVCPCCQRTFPALAAHVASKHPDFAHRDIESLSARMRQLLASIRQATDSEDEAVIDIDSISANRGTLRALVNRGLVEVISWRSVALTEAGWPLAEQITTEGA